MAGLMGEVAAAYREQNPHVTFRTSVLNSEEGLRAVLREDAEIGLVARPLSANEIRSADTGAPRVSVFPTGQEAVAVIVNAANPVEDLSLAQLRSIYTGETWIWPDVGGAAGEIAVVTREEGSGTRDVFEATVLKGTRLTPRAMVMPSTEAVASYVGDHPQAIGYLSACCGLEGLRVLSLGGVLPEATGMEDGSYLLVRPLYLVTAITPSAEVRDFISFASGPEGRAVVQREGFR
jgi:phosphate transport system substrate-binding protein